MMSNKALLGKRAEDLSNLIEQQTQPIFDNLGIIVPIKSCSTLLCLHKLEQASLADIARDLEQSHQLVKQKLPKLIKLGLIKQRPDKEDKRRTLYSLTVKGKSQTEKVQTYLNQSEQLVDTVSKDIGIDVFEAIDQAIKSLQGKSLWERIKGIK
ncbi:MarR family winged helix-turn-helix transcriptional regulator [Kangiella aquimarina]|uniref:Winged helix DNA-binding protein n=1 Tax=Kangiella aquimarina TaxID=261965 RepID=A0ABZ0X0P9_9GAMM|nr:winged helix DNA-binding protein [Kangiella aquimarina]WQG84158.1 winged helix DNA-binding protein [Kangiella aquimarina]